jgi:uncharacterized protein with PIN domain
MPEKTVPETRFIADRMLGTLTRYLRFMGYDTASANALAPGNAREDTLLLDIAAGEDRILLTRDAELARRGKERAVLIASEDVMDQVEQLIGLRLVERRLLLSRCSLCNTPLRVATEGEIAGAEYAPADRTGFSFFWCDSCRKLYWNGSHGRQLGERIGRGSDLLHKD